MSYKRQELLALRFNFLFYSKLTSEKREGAIINGQSREMATLGTLDIGQRQAKHKRNTENQKKRTSLKTEGEPMIQRRASSSCQVNLE
jgi:hypothetical protein